MEKESYRTEWTFKKKIGKAKPKRKMDKNCHAIVCTSRRWELCPTHHCQNHHVVCCASRDVQKKDGPDRHVQAGMWNGADSLLTVRCQMRARGTK